MSTSSPNVRILFVCLGNICRSPAAEGIFRNLINRKGLDEAVFVDSAGTGAWHVGEPPDRRMRETTRRHGISLDGQRARTFDPADFGIFDVILAMDGQNLSDLKLQARDGNDLEKIHLFREFDPETGGGDVPDPYWSGTDGFEKVFQIIDRTSHALLDWVLEAYEIEGASGTVRKQARDRGSGSSSAGDQA